MTERHPYQSLPSHSFWRKSISAIDPGHVDPVVRAPFTISPHDKIVTAGSCFAQHIGRQLHASGFNYFVTEMPHPAVADVAGAEYSYGLFSARYGNVYTARQLLQLLHRAYDLFKPVEAPWIEPDGTLLDPFRPTIQEGGFPTLLEFNADRQQHFRAVRRAVEELDIFVFTLGLTETWEATADGAVFPVCPGVSGGKFNSTHYRFLNFDVGAVTSDLNMAVEFIRSKNPAAKFILTVSPVPMIATMEDRSVLVSTTYSKSVLRVAAEVVQTNFQSVAYFPSYEIICGNFNRGRYFATDLRSVTQDGVDHVMSLFMRHYAREQIHVEEAPIKQPTPTNPRDVVMSERVAHALCDEELLDGG